MYSLESLVRSLEAEALKVLKTSILLSGTYHKCLWWWRAEHNPSLGSKQERWQICFGGSEDMHFGGEVSYFV